MTAPRPAPALATGIGGPTAPKRTLDPKIQAFLNEMNARGGPPLNTLSYGKARAFLAGIQTGRAVKLPASIEEHDLPTSPRRSVSIRIVRPRARTGALPVIMYFHGGGWVLGDEETHDRLVRELSNGADAAVVFVNYTLSPEAQFPVPIEEAYAATKYIAEHGASLNLDPARMAVAGDGVGGNMAAVVTQLAKQRGGPPLKYQVLFYPVTDANFEDDSYHAFANGPWLTKAEMQWFFDSYAPNLIDRRKPLVSPLQASIEQLTGLPAALIITDENDVVRDEGEAYAQKLMQAGVTVKAVRFLGAIHDFVMLDAIADAPEAQSATALANKELHLALDRRD